MIKRLFAIGFIFCCVSVAWFILAGATSTRTNSADSSLKSRVAQLWGAPQTQLPPSIVAWEMATKKVESLEDGKKIIKTVEEKLTDKLTLDSSDIKVALKLDHRQKGLLWYSTYGVDFAATYVVTNPSKVVRNIEISLPFPAKRAVFDDLRFELDGAKWITKPSPGEDKFVGQTRLGAGESAILRVGYRSQGLDRWSYNFGSGVSEVRNFKLAMSTNFEAIDFPDDAISPVSKERTADGWALKWEYRHLVSGVNIAMAMPSIRWNGSPSISMRSAKVPESPSSALQTTYLRAPIASATVFHLMPVGKPAPPRPRSPDFSTASIVASGPMSRARARPFKPPVAR